MTPALFAGIALAHLVAAMSPGPSFVVAVRVAAGTGFRAALAFAFGLGIGAAIWAGAALFGLALIFQIVPALHTGLKIAGGLFLLWIAFQLWRHAKDPLPEVEAGRAPSLVAQIGRGIATQLANPKPAVFFGAVFIGLVPPGTSPLWMALILAMILIDETLWYAFVAYAFSRGRARSAYGRAKTWADRVFAGLLGALGARIALS